jgi:hypothetical protein
MLPGLRMVPVGGVLISIVILTLNLVLSRPGEFRAYIAPIETPARGTLIALADHPEWRQFFILAAFQRTDEIDRLRELPDTPTRVEPVPEGAMR